MINKLEMFIAVAKEGHFGRAAESLGITQPTLSTGIKQLEEMLGVQLIFSRFALRRADARGCACAGLGAAAGQRQPRLPRGDARQPPWPVGSPPAGRDPHGADMGRPAFRRALPRRIPNVRFTILSRNSSEILKMLENLEVDAGISYLDNEPLGRVTTAPIYTEHYTLVCHADNPLALESEVTWADLSGERLCLLTPDMQNRRIINQCFMEADVTPEALVESNSTVVLAAHVEGGRLGHCLTL